MRLGPPFFPLCFFFLVYVVFGELLKRLTASEEPHKCEPVCWEKKEGGDGGKKASQPATQAGRQAGVVAGEPPKIMNDKGSSGSPKVDNLMCSRRAYKKDRSTGTTQARPRTRSCKKTPADLCHAGEWVSPAKITKPGRERERRVLLLLRIQNKGEKTTPFTVALREVSSVFESRR